ncbi:MAG: hypothetical protein ACRDZM_05255 [Acidimicrobiia bacterium]
MSSRLRRVVAMVGASMTVLALGLVVAVAAGSLPGGAGTEPLIDLDLRLDLDLSPVFAWTLMILAVAGLVLFALGLRETTSRQEKGRRSLLGVLIGLILFIAVFRWVRPAVEGLLDQGRNATDSAADAVADGDAGSPSGWLFSLLLAAVMAATLTRIGLSVRGAGSPFGPEREREASSAPDLPAHPGGRVLELPLGEDPRSRILDAYQDFETGLGAVGLPRHETETTARHALKSARELDLDTGLVNELVGKHVAARYGATEPVESDAVTAEQSSAALLRRMME